MRGLQIYNKIKENPNMASTFLEQMREKDLKKKTLVAAGGETPALAAAPSVPETAPVPQAAEPPAPVTSTTPPAQTMREKLAAEVATPPPSGTPYRMTTLEMLHEEAAAKSVKTKTDLNPLPFTPPAKPDDLQEKLEASVATPTPPATPSRGVGRRGVKKPVALEAVPVPVPPVPATTPVVEAARERFLSNEQNQQVVNKIPTTENDLHVSREQFAAVLKEPCAKVEKLGMTLYVNCAPLDHATQYVLFSHYVHSVHEQVSSAHALPVYQLGQFEGKAHFVNYVKQLLADAPQAAIVVDSRTDEGRDALPWLERAAARIVRGF